MKELKSRELYEIYMKEYNNLVSSQKVVKHWYFDFFFMKFWLIRFEQLIEIIEHKRKVNTKLKAYQYIELFNQ